MISRAMSIRLTAVSIAGVGVGYEDPPLGGGSVSPGGTAGAPYMNGRFTAAADDTTGTPTFYIRWVPATSMATPMTQDFIQQVSIYDNGGTLLRTYATAPGAGATFSSNSTSLQWSWATAAGFVAGQTYRIEVS